MSRGDAASGAQWLTWPSCQGSGRQYSKDSSHSRIRESGQGLREKSITQNGDGTAQSVMAKLQADPEINKINPVDDIMLFIYFSRELSSPD